MGKYHSWIDLIRKVTGESAYGLSVPLLTKSDGEKFGKTATGTIWLDPAMTSPYAFYQFFINSDDRDVAKLLKIFSFKSHAAIDEL